ncbi:MAG: hypothetical protein LBN07_04910, partial [Christensenellaceae bacterium]|nr:hypothetical protein [Christensenellaceae bacterium]
MSKTKKSILATGIALLLLVVFAFVSMFQTVQSVTLGIREGSVGLAANSVSSTAAEFDDIYTPSEQELFSEEEYDKTEIIGEDTSKRTETSKTFVQADGTFVMQEYGKAVHYLEGDEYFDIDNTLNENLQNTNNSFKVSFNDGSRDSLVSITDTHGSISMTPILTDYYQAGSASVYSFDGNKNITTISESETALVKGNNGVTSKNLKGEANSEKRTQSLDYGINSLNAIDSLNIKNSKIKDNLTNKFTNHNSAILYENIFNEVDFQYILEGKNLKENIIVNQQLNEYVFRFELNLENLVAYKASNGDILITNQSGELTYIIPKGYMYDAIGTYSYDVEYELEYNPNGTSFLTVIADRAFFETAVFPVVVDPTIEYLDVKHITIGSYFVSTILYTGTHYTYMDLDSNMFNVSGKTIIDAKLDLHGQGSGVNSGTFTVTVKDTKVKNTSVHTAATLCDLTVEGGGLMSVNLLTIDIFPYISNSGYLNSAMILISQMGNKIGNTLMIPFPITLYEITISYIEHQGIDNNDHNIVQDMGDSGQGVISLNTGKMNYVYDDVVIDDGYMPINISHIYDENFGNTYGVGYGFKLNLQQKISYDSNRQLYTYTDASGKLYYFAGDSIPYNQELGLKLHFKNLSALSYPAPFNNGGPSNYICAIDRFGNSMIFTYYGRLVQVHQYPSTIENPKAALMLKITLDNAGSDKIMSVTNNKTTLDFIYNNGCGALSAITINNNIAVSYTGIVNSGNFFLQTATKYFDIGGGYITYFGYTGSLLTKIGCAPNDYDLEYTYNLGKISNVRTFERYGGVKTPQDVSFSYSYYVPNGYYEKGMGVSRSVILNHDDTYQYVSFCNNDVIADYAYEVDGQDIIPLYAESNGFDYFGFINIYANTRDILTFDTFNYATNTTTINVNESGLNSYALSLWTKNEQVINIVKAIVTTKDAANNIKTFTYNFHRYELGWQFGTIIIKDIADLRQVTIQVSFQRPTVYVKDVRLVRLPSAPPTEDDYEIKYNSDKQVSQVRIEKKGVWYGYEYYPANPSLPEYPGLIKSVTERTLSHDQISKTEYFYDGNNNLTSIKSYGSSSSYMTSSCSYDGFGHITSVTDENGVETNYTYNPDGTVTTIIVGDANSPNVTITDEYYQGSGLLKSINTGGVQTNFIYNNFGGLQTINHNSFNTNFSYDSNYNLSGISIGSQQLVNYSYSKLQDTVTYGNSQTVAYNYSNDGYLTSMTNGSNQNIASFNYNNLGWLSSISHANGVSYGYQYSSDLQAGGMGHVNLAYSMTNNGNTLASHYTSNAPNISEVYYYYNGGPKDYYKDLYDSEGRLSMNYRNPTIYTTYNYDTMDRLDNKTFVYNGKTFNNVYNYQPGTVTNGLVYSEQFKVNNVKKTDLTYSYYSNGLLEYVVPTAQANNAWTQYLVWYYYDNSGRLSREYNRVANRIYSYFYDNGGNIIRKDEHDISWNWVTQTLYYYENPWGDQLTSYKVWTTAGWGNLIYVNYDGAGNPTNWKWGSGMPFEWQNGRELKSIGGANYISYDYDYAGLRTKK